MARDYIDVLNKARFSGGDHAAAKAKRSVAVLFASKKRSDARKRPRKRLTATVKGASLSSGVRVRHRRGKSGKPPSTGASHMAKRRKARRSGRKLTKAERRAISIRNLRKARRARKGPKRRHARAAAAEAPRRRRRRRAHAAAPAAQAPRRRRRRRHARAAEAPAAQASRRSRRRRAKGRRRFTAKQRAAALRNLGKARAKRRYYKRIHRKHPVKAYSYYRRPKRVRVRAHRSYEAPRRRRRHHRRRHAYAAAPRRRHHRGGRRQKYVMENPLSGTELFIGVITGGIGFVTMSLVDRFMATHALTAGATGAANAGTFADVPPTTGDYPNLYNATAVLAPMNWKRWAAGTLGPLVPIFAATMVKAPAGRSALQMFGVGALLHTAGKGLTTLLANLSQSTSFGQRVYDAEIRAASLSAGTTPTAPSSGLGRPLRAGQLPRQMGTGSSPGLCKPCSNGTSVPVSSQPPASQPTTPPPVVSQPPPPPPPPSMSNPTSGSYPNPVLGILQNATPVPTGNYGLTGQPRGISRNEWASQE